MTTPTPIATAENELAWEMKRLLSFFKESKR